MSKILFLTDVHIGARSGSKVFRDHFKRSFNEWIFPLIEQEQIETVICLGDFFDNRNNLTLHDLDYIKRDFIPNFVKTGATMHILAGNHDIAFRNTNAINSLSIFDGVESIKVYDEEIGVVGFGELKFVLCPWINPFNRDRFLEELKFYANKEHILCMHGEFSGTKMYANSPGFEGGLEPADFSKFLKVLSGHFHHPSVYGNIEYIGAMSHLTWMCYGDWRGVQVWDLESGDIKKVANPECLFLEVDFHEIAEDPTLITPEVFTGKIVRITIKEPYESVDLKALVAEIEKMNPVSLDVIDYTILDIPQLQEIEGEDASNQAEAKEVIQYFEDALVDHPQRDDVLSLVSELYEEAKQKMKEIE